MNQSAVEFDEAELQGCQPVEMVGVYRSEKFSDRRLALLCSKSFSLAFAAATTLRQELLFPLAAGKRRGLDAPGAFGPPRLFSRTPEDLKSGTLGPSQPLDIRESFSLRAAVAALSRSSFAFGRLVSLAMALTASLASVVRTRF